MSIHLVLINCAGWCNYYNKSYIPPGILETSQYTSHSQRMFSEFGRVPVSFIKDPSCGFSQAPNFLKFEKIPTWVPE